MDRVAFQTSPSGRLIPTIEGSWAFVPHSLPPRGLDINPIIRPLTDASLALGELNGIGRTLANPYLLVSPLQRREAVSSSSMEGTHTTISDLLLLEAGASSDRPLDTREVLNHVEALNHAVKRLPDLPLSVRLLCETHERLLHGVAKHRGAAIQAGQLKRDQNWIGGSGRIADARFVPPPQTEATTALSDLEKYLHREDRSATPALLDAALVHYQFETIHPFADGNGRIGRMLIPLMLLERGALAQPLLYMSPHLEKHKDRYIDLMLNVSRTGEWLPWLSFFLDAVTASCLEAIAVVKRLQDLQKEYRERCQTAKRSALLLRIIDFAFQRPALSVSEIAAHLDVTYQGALNNVNILITLKMARDFQRDDRNVYPRIIMFPEILAAISTY
jgi:Fic family protein